jgi:hypothetical protein
MMMLGSRGGGSEPMAREPATAAAEPGGAKAQPKKGGAFEQMDDDIPF